MENVKPCPYCGGEVEVVRMPDLKGQKTYRISCKKCHMLVARSQGGFPIETLSDAEDRIRDYEAYIERQFRKTGSLCWRQTKEAKQRDSEAKYMSRSDKDDDYGD